MFRNLFGHPDERMFRKMGYFNDQSGILRRYHREREHWDIHLNNTRQSVIEAMQDKRRDSAAVLGSGWLLDVPAEEMSRHFGKLTLYDIRHPTAVKKQARLLGNAELRACDISGFAQPVYQYVKQYRNCKNRPTVCSIQPQSALDLSGYDFVFSCNILNQLDILLLDYLAQFFDLSHEESVSFSGNVQKHHIDALPRNRTCIVVDYETIAYSQAGKELMRKKSVYHPIIQRSDAKRWTWKFDTKMTYYKDRMAFFEVMSCSL